MALDVVTTIVAAALSHDLIDLETAKTELGIADSDASNDDWLARNISAVSHHIENYCDRVFVVETLSDLFELQQDPYPWQVPGGAAVLQLSRWPLALFAQLQTTADAPQGTTVLALPDTSALIDALPVAGLNVPAGTIIVPGSIEPAQVTLSAPLAGDMPAGSTAAFGIAVTQQIGLGAAQTLVPGSDFTVDPRKGQIVRLDPFTGVKVNWEAYPTTVLYSAGYQEIPGDLADAALQWLGWRFNTKGRDPSMRVVEEAGRRREYWVGGPPKSGDTPSEISGCLDRYKVPVIA